jgi:biofilm PGA synthesis N-glycosyltransferase PgaC
MNLAVWIFCFCLALIVYVLAGYPLLLAVWARLFPRPIRKSPQFPTVSVIVPVRNGARWIEAKLASLLACDYPGDLLDVLVVSDGSSDQTNDLVSRYPDHRVKLLALPPGGKAAAVNRGMERVSGAILVLTDVRQSFDPQAIARLVACFDDPRVGVVTGELVIREGASHEEYNTGLYWRYEKWIRRNLNRIDAMLGATGSIYAIRRELAAPIPSEILLDDVYLPLSVAFRGARIYFEDQAWAYDLPTSLQSEFWRKVRTQAGIYQILLRFPSLLSPLNRRFVHFLSHKLGRLLLPFALLGIALDSFFLGGWWRAAAIGGQLLFYMLALLDPLIPAGNPVKRLSGVIRAFVVLTAAAFCALAVFVMPAQRLWKETRGSSAPQAEPRH